MTTTFLPGTPNWADLGTSDVPAATAFYRTLFGWTVDDMGPDAGGYGIIRKDGKQVAGIGPATDPARGTSWAVYFATDDAAASAAKVEANGGKVVMAPMEVMDQGTMAVFQDPTGAYFNVWQPANHRGAEHVGDVGGMCWAELMSNDMDAAKAFYRSVLGVTTFDAPMPQGSYTLLKVGEENVAGAMGIGPDQGDMPSQWSVYFAVEDTDAVADKAIELGGSQMVRADSPAGRFAFLVDPQGGQFCILTPNPDFSV